VKGLLLPTSHHAHARTFHHGHCRPSSGRGSGVTNAACTVPRPACDSAACSSFADRASSASGNASGSCERSSVASGAARRGEGAGPSRQPASARGRPFTPASAVTAVDQPRPVILLGSRSCLGSSQAVDTPPGGIEELIEVAREPAVERFGVADAGRLPLPPGGRRRITGERPARKPAAK